jgi:hypothetical protein
VLLALQAPIDEYRQFEIGPASLTWLAVEDMQLRLAAADLETQSDAG